MTSSLQGLGSSYSGLGEDACYPGWGLYNNECNRLKARDGPRNEIIPGGPLPPVHNMSSNCLPSPFSPYGGALEWQSNELILKDPCLRRLARVSPLDCDIRQLYIINPIPKL
jgi:hypothetical protein